MRKIDDSLRAQLVSALKALQGAPENPEAAVSQALTPDINGAVTAVSERGESLTRLGDYLVETKYLGVAYDIVVTKKTPAPIENLTSAIGLLQSAEAPPLKVSMVSGTIWNGKVFDIVEVPSDIAVTGSLTVTEPGTGLKKTLPLGSATFDNEGLYYWDISLGIPIRTVKDVNYSDADKFVYAKDVDRQKLLAMLDIFPKPLDTKAVQTRLLPFPVVGMALSKRPLDTMVAGLAIGLNRITLFGGVRWDRLEPAGGQTDSAERDDSGIHYKRSWQIALNVPVRQVVDYFKAKK